MFSKPRVLSIAIIATYVIGLCVFAYFASVVENFPLEIASSNLIQSLRTPWLDSFILAFSVLGTTVVGAATIVIVCALLYIIGWRVESAVVLITSAAGQAATLIIKQIVARPRPSQDVVDVLREADSFSFPSNHVMLYTVLLVTLMFILTVKVRQNAALRILQAALVMLLLLTGFSRIYLGVHWLGDVIGGYAFGMLIAACASLIWFRWNEKRIESNTT